MSSDVVIRAEGLGKKYMIGHQSSERYTSLRDVMAQTAKNFARSTGNMFRGKAIIAGDEVEEFWALKDVSFEVKRGDVVGVVGRNGAGKSTLLKVLSRITEPSEGRVQIKGRVASLLEVGTGFHPELSGRENIFLNGAILGMTRAEINRKFDEIVDFAGVEKFLDTPVKRYSSGMYVRLAFSVAAHLEPEILVVDEVLAVGDSDFQTKCLGKMREVAGQGRTVLFVSHNMTAVRRLCRSGILLSDGRVEKVGPIGEVLSAYAAHSQNKNASLLENAAQRRGSGEARVEALELLDEQGSLSVGGSVRFRLTVSSQQAGEYRPWLLFRGPVGEDLLMIMPTNDQLFAIDGKQRIECSFNSPMAPGVYSVACGLLDNGGGIVDWADDALALNVDQTFLTGQSYDQRLGAVTMLGDWSLAKIELVT